MAENFSFLLDVFSPLIHIPYHLFPSILEDPSSALLPLGGPSSVSKIFCLFVISPLTLAETQQVR